MPKFVATDVGGGNYCPLLPIEVRIPQCQPFGVNAIVDSGADFTIIPAEIVASAGVDIAALPPYRIPLGRGGGGSFDLLACTGELFWRNKKFAEDFAVAEPKKLPAVLLGRVDFFRRYRIQFHWYRHPPEFDIMET